MASKSVVIIGTRGYPSYYGGFETAVRKLAPDLADKGWDVTVYGRGDREGSTIGGDPRVRTKVTSGINTKSLSTLTFGLTASIHAAWKKPDVALVMNVANGYWLPLLRLRRIPVLVNVDGIEWDRAKWGRLAKRVFRAGAWLTARFGTRLVFDAQAIANRWKAEFRRDGIFIPYGGEPALPRLPLEPGLGHRTYVLFVARFVPENSIAEFVGAAQVLATKFDIVIVGSTGHGGYWDQAILDLADSHPRIQWLGHVNDDARLHSLWQHAGAYFHGHSVGGTNPALVQAMVCGAPTVARDTVYNREVLGESGVFVAPDANEIARAISSVMSTPLWQESLARAAQERATSEYSWSEVTASYEAELEQLRVGSRSSN